MSSLPAPSNPQLTPDEQAGMQDFFQVYEANQADIDRQQLERLKRYPTLAAVSARMTAGELNEQARRNRALLRGALSQNAWDPFLIEQQAQGQGYAGHGVSFREWLDMMSDLETLLVPWLVNAYVAEPPRLARALKGMGRYLNLTVSATAEAYLATKEKRILQQQDAIQELSTPVLQISERVLLLPIIGIIDTQRARMLTQEILRVVRSARAKVVVMDITGVPAVDSRVANHLLQTVAAVRLMGARSIITGITADVAQSLVVLGVDLGELHTVSDLMGGLEEAEALMSRKRQGRVTRAVKKREART